MLSLGQKIPTNTKVALRLLHMKLKNILYFPRFVFTIVTQLAYYALTEVETFLLVVLSGLLGWELGWQWGLIAFLGIYLFMRMTGGYVHVILRELAGIRSRN